MLKAYTDAAAEEIGRVIAEIQREARQAERLRDVEHRERIALFNAALLRADAEIAERLTALRDGRDGEPGASGEKGERGQDGALGPQGERGEPGEQGIAGADGAPGYWGELDDDAFRQRVTAAIKSAIVFRGSRTLRSRSGDSRTFQAMRDEIVGAIKNMHQQGVNVSVPVNMPKRAKERTIVEEHDANGRIKSFIRYEVED